MTILAERPHHEADPASRQPEHHQRVEEAGGHEIDRQIHQDSRGDDDETDENQQEAQARGAVEKQHADAEESGTSDNPKAE